MNLAKYIMIICLCQTISGLYTYDKFYNRGIQVDFSDNHPYYTSNIFHSVEYAAKNNTLKLRRININASKSLPEIIL